MRNIGRAGYQLKYFFYCIILQIGLFFLYRSIINDLSHFAFDEPFNNLDYLFGHYAFFNVAIGLIEFMFLFRCANCLIKYDEE